MNQFNTNSTNPLFQQLFNAFLDKYCTWQYANSLSCSDYYFNLKQCLVLMEPFIKSLYRKAPPSDKPIIIKTYKEEIINRTAILADWLFPEKASLCLTQNNCTLEQLFEPRNFSRHDPNSFPGFLFYVEKELTEKDINNIIIINHASFLCYICKYFIDKFIDLIENLPYNENLYSRKMEKIDVLNNPSEQQFEKVKRKKKQIKDTNKSAFSFIFIGKPNNLLNFINFLNTRLNESFLNDLESNPQELFDVLTANPILPNTPKIYFSCQTTQLAYIFNRLTPLFENLNFNSIGESNLFYTRQKIQLTENNLSKSKSSCNNNPSQKNIIDQAFEKCFKTE
jgi:hypothetical protein